MGQKGTSRKRPPFSRVPVLLAQLKAQDLGKLALAALLVLGVLGGLVLTHWRPELGEAMLALLKT